MIGVVDALRQLRPLQRTQQEGQPELDGQAKRKRDQQCNIIDTYWPTSTGKTVTELRLEWRTEPARDWLPALRIDAARD